MFEEDKQNTLSQSKLRNFSAERDENIPGAVHIEMGRILCFRPYAHSLDIRPPTPRN